MQVLGFLQDSKMDVLVAGDSMMRQLYIRLVHMMRGANRVLDYHIHTHANYKVVLTASPSLLVQAQQPLSTEGFISRTC